MFGRTSLKYKTLLSICAFVLVTACGVSSVCAQGDEKHEDVILQAIDGWPIHISYYKAGGKGMKEAPVVVMLPDAKSTRQIWNSVALELQKKGYAVITVDLRKHGDSQAPGSEQNPDKDKEEANFTAMDYQAMLAGDMEAVKNFIVERHEAKELNVRKLGLVGIGPSAVIGIRFAQADWGKRPWPDGPTPATSTPRGQDVRAIAMISPLATLPRMSTSEALRVLKLPQFGIAFHVIVGEQDSKALKDAERIHSAITIRDEAATEARQIIRFPTEANGRELLRDSVIKHTEEELVKFFDAYLMPLESPWQTRKNRLQD